MAILLLNSGDSQWTIPSGGINTNVNGTSGVDKIAISSGAKVSLDSSFNAGVDYIYIQSDSSQFTVSRLGASVTLTDSSSNTISIPAGAAGQKLIFGNGFLNLQISSGKVMIGSQEITTTAASITAAADASQTSDSQFSGGGSTPTTGTTVSIDVGTSSTQQELNAGTGSFNYTDSASVLTNVKISSFTSDDKITVSNASSGTYSFANNGTDVDITYNNSGVMNHITLVGVVNSSALVYDETSFESAVGFNAFNYA